MYTQNVLLALAGVAALTLLYWICRAIYNLYFHPLAKVPGPRFAAISDLWLAFQLTSGYMVQTLEVIHRKYGDVVRVAPNEVSVVNVDAWREIYKYGQKEMKDKTVFVKSAGYNNGGAPNMFSERDPEVHAGMRKMFSHAFSTKALRDQEDVIHSYVDMFMEQVGKLGHPDGRGLDMTEAYQWLTFDITGDLSFGEPFGAVESGKSPFWVTILAEALFISTLDNLRKRMPIFTLYLLYMMPKGFMKSLKDHQALTEAKVRKRMEMGNLRDRDDFFDNILRNKEGMPFDAMVSQSSLLIIAGADTSSSFLAGVTYMLLRNPEKLRRASAEVRSHFAAISDITGDKASQLEYLNAVIEEGLRTYPPVAIGLCRVVPPGGATIAGHFFPGGTVISVPIFRMNHDERFWNKPFEFIPERWIGKGLGDNKEAAKPFILGPRGCLGINLAYLEMRIALAKLLFAYDWEMASQSADLDYIRDSRNYALWKKPPMFVKFHPRKD